MEIATGNLCPISQPLEIIQEIISNQTRLYHIIKYAL
jgi:hypothetical protein